MSAQDPFSTPRCRITGTTVTSGGVANNVVRAGTVMTLFAHAWIDPAVKASFGIWVVDHRLIGVPDPPGNRAGDYFHLWSGLLKNLPTNSAGFFNPNTTWFTAESATNGELGWYVYQPRIVVRDFQGGQDDFAYPEDLHYILLTDEV
jgi:hypothetical protein